MGSRTSSTDFRRALTAGRQATGRYRTRARARAEPRVSNQTFNMFMNRETTIDIPNGLTTEDILTWYLDSYIVPSVNRELRQAMEDFGMIKMDLIVVGYSPSDGGSGSPPNNPSGYYGGGDASINDSLVYRRSNNQRVVGLAQNVRIRNLITSLMSDLEITYQRNTTAIMQIKLNIARYDPLGGGTYLPLPRRYQNSKKGVINVVTKDDLCFVYAVAAARARLKGIVHKHPERPGRYTSDVEDLMQVYRDAHSEEPSFPVSTPDIAKWERALKFKINVITIVKGLPAPSSHNLASGLKHDPKTTVTLLMWNKQMADNMNKKDSVSSRDPTEEEYDAEHCAEQKGHFAAIVDWKAFSAVQRVSNNRDRGVFCPVCLARRTTTKAMAEHLKVCNGNDGGYERMPVEGDNFLRHKVTNAQAQCPVVIYADTEAWNDPSGSLPSTESTMKLCQQKMISYRLQVVAAEGFDLGDVPTEYDYVYDADDPNSAMWDHDPALHMLITLRDLQRQIIERFPQDNGTNGDLYTWLNKNKALWLSSGSTNNGNDAEHRDPKTLYAVISAVKKSAEYICTREQFAKVKGVGPKMLEVFGNAIPWGDLLERQSAKDLNMSPEEEERHARAKTCYLCMQPFQTNLSPEQRDAGLVKCRDHDHFTGKYRGAAHLCCNSKLKQSYQRNHIPVYIHNSAHYDLHFLIEAMHKLDPKCKFDTIATNSQVCRSLTVSGLVFRDSCALLNNSLDNCLKSLDDADKVLLRGMCEQRDGELTALGQRQFELVKKKGHFPYDYLDDVRKLKGPLPMDAESWYSRLSASGPSEADFVTIRQVCDAFGIDPRAPGAFKQWHDLYLEIDVKGLADVMQKFRSLTMENWGLDTPGYLSIPGLCWAARLKNWESQEHMSDEERRELYPDYDSWSETQKAKLGTPTELLTDTDQLHAFQSLVRGGISSVGGARYNRTNHPDLPGYDASRKICVSQDLDANNLYGGAMTQKLPHSDFGTHTPADDDWEPLLDTLLIGRAKFIPSASWNDQDEGAVLTVDLEYPEHLHDSHNDYPLAPELCTISPDMLSPYNKKYNEAHHRRAIPQRKLVAHLGPRKNYVVLAKACALYQELGMRVTKVHQVITYTQVPYMRSWVELNTRLRQQAVRQGHDFLAGLYKLANNSVYGKLMEDVTKHRDAKFVRTRLDLQRKINNPLYQNCMIIKEMDANGENGLVKVMLSKGVIEYNKPLFAGGAVLDESKVVMYDAYYNGLKQMFPNVRLGGTDTDSFMVDIEVDTKQELYDGFLSKRHMMDLSNFPPEHPLYDPTNCKVLNKLKFEITEPVLISERVHLKPKMYAFAQVDPRTGQTFEMKRCKGVKMRVTKEMRIEEYKHVLKHSTMLSKTQVDIRAHNHKLYLVEQRKAALSAYDDKRYILADGIHTLAYGHKDIPRRC